MNTHTTLLTSLLLALAGLAQAGDRLTYVKFGPCRVMEARAEAFESLTLAMGDSRCAVPAAARVYVLTVTARPLQGRLETVRVSTGGRTSEQVTVMAREGQTVSNTALVEAGPGSTVDVTASAATEMKIDITGYFTDDRAVSNLVFYPLAPCRVVDTRNVFRAAASMFGPPALRSGETRRFRIAESPECHVPPGAAAYALNVTMVPWGSALSVAAKGERTGLSGVFTNHVILPAELDGSIAITAGTASDVLVEIHGYFAADDGATGLYYRPLQPCKVSDTRAGNQNDPFGGPAIAGLTARTVPVALAAHCEGMTAQAKAYALQVTALPEGQPLPFVAVYPTPRRPDPRGFERPDTATLHAFEGQAVTNFTIVAAGEGGSISAYALERTDLMIGVVGMFLR
jgi:hypothetical protein